jgi:hypothetical protein
MDVNGQESCGTHAEAACGGHASPCDAHAQACGGHAESCGTAADACCQTNAFMLPATDEAVTISATDLAWLLDYVEASAEGASSLEEESYVRSRNALREQAPRLIALREEFLNQIRALMAAES